MTFRLLSARTHVLLAAVAALLLPASALAQDTEALFDASAMQEIRLAVNTRDLRQLRDRYEENTYYTADFQWRNIRVRNIGIRSRGSASRNPNKLGLRVDFDRYVSGQRFLGLKSIVLKNFW